MSVTIRNPMLSGHCAFPQTARPEESHLRCSGGNTANLLREFQPCPCPCHYPEDRYECEGCGGLLVRAGYWPDDSDEDPSFVHVDPRTDRITGYECVSGNRTAES